MSEKISNKSALGYCWKEKYFDQRLALTIQQRFEIPHYLAQILSSRNIDLLDVENFLNPTIKASLPNPFDLLDMDKAVDYVISAINNKKKITIFADYDVDGATASAILKLFFKDLDVDVDIYVPDRISEGYGPNISALLNIKNNGTDLVITVDCGTVAFAALEEAAKNNLDVIVIDHHIGVTEKPKAIAVVNPNRIDDNFEHKNICAATVCFLFAVAINKRLKDDGFYANKKQPNLLNYLDLVALGTVCDVMPLLGLNRALVSQGLKIIKKRSNKGIKAICDAANINEEINSYHLGYIIGPRINAGGRVGKSNLGANILSTNDDNLASQIATNLNLLNDQRKDVEKIVLEQSIDNLEKAYNGFSCKDDIIFAVGNSWHHGVIGIVASRLKDLYNRPVAVITLENKKGKASCRSIAGIDFGNAILQARINGLLIEGGGHAMAGGFSVDEKLIKNLHIFFNENLSSKVQLITSNSTKEFDIIIDIENINHELITNLEALQPFGVGNRKPKFMIRNSRVLNSKIIGKNQEHVSCNLASLSNIGFSSAIPAVAFNSINNSLGTYLMESKGRVLNIIGDISINNWMGIKKLQIIIEDIQL